MRTRYHRLMTTRRAFLPLLASPLAAQQQVLYRDYARCLPDFLRHLAAEAVKTRIEAIGKLTTSEAIRARQQWVRDTFWKLAGGQPEKTPLRVQTVGELRRDGYRLEKILYESRPEFPISANLYIPTTGKPPYPAVLYQLGHSLIGKAYTQYQKSCQGLARLGFVVLAFDPMGQGERIYYPASDPARTRLSSADDEHTVPGQLLLLTGITATQIQTWDAVRSLDVLASHPLVDPRRIASTGNSGGGTLTMFLAAVDDRLAAAAPACPNTENFACEDFLPPGSTDDAEQNFAGAGPLGFDRWDTLYPIAPKPLLVLVSSKDFFGTYSPSYIRNGRQEYERLAGVYRTLGNANQIAWWESPLPHGMHYSVRMEVYQWMRRWLQGENQPLAAEPRVSPEAERDLWVTPSGSLLQDRRSVHPVTFAARAEAGPPPWKQLLGIEEPAERPRRIALGTAPSEDCHIDAVEVASSTHVWVPYWLFRPHRPTREGEVLVLLDPAGRNARAGEGGLCHELARAGLTVCAPDLRGIGDLTPEVGRGAPRYTVSHLKEDHWAWASLMLGQSLLGQRVADLISVVRSLGPVKVRVAARGRMVVPALFAALLEPRIERLFLSEGLDSYRSLLTSKEYTEPFANFVPGILRHGDLPEIRARLRTVSVPWTAQSLSTA